MSDKEINLKALINTIHSADSLSNEQKNEIIAIFTEFTLGCGIREASEEIVKDIVYMLITIWEF